MPIKKCSKIVEAATKAPIGVIIEQGKIKWIEKSKNKQKGQSNIKVETTEIKTEQFVRLSKRQIVYVSFKKYEVISISYSK
jgi:hypothetical protein